MSVLSKRNADTQLAMRATHIHATMRCNTLPRLRPDLAGSELRRVMLRPSSAHAVHAARRPSARRRCHHPFDMRPFDLLACQTRLNGLRHANPPMSPIPVQWTHTHGRRNLPPSSSPSHVRLAQISFFGGVLAVTTVWTTPAVSTPTLRHIGPGGLALLL